MSSGENAQQPAESFTEIAPYYDKLMASVPYRFWLSYVEALWRTHGCLPKRILDLACGTGTLSFLLADKGMDVVGVDRSSAMIAGANLKAEENGKKVEFIVADATEMPPIHPPVDSALCLFDSLNNILDMDGLTRALAAVKNSLTPDGIFIFDMNTAYAFRQGMFNQRSSPLDRPLNYVWKSKYNEDNHLCTVTMNFEIEASDGNPARRFVEEHVQRAYNRVEVEDMLTTAGFTDITPYDAYTLFRPRKRSDRIFWVAR